MVAQYAASRIAQMSYFLVMQIAYFWSFDPAGTHEGSEDPGNGGPVEERSRADWALSMDHRGACCQRLAADTIKNLDAALFRDSGSPVLRRTMCAPPPIRAGRV